MGRSVRFKSAVLATSTAMAMSAMAIGPSLTTAQAKTSGTFLLGVAEPLTGSQANYGVLEYDAQQLAAAYINAHGGINGEKLQLLSWDTKADPATGVAGTHYFVSKHVNAVAGMFDSDVTIPSIRILQQAGIPLFGDNPSTPQLASMHLTNFTRITGDDALEGLIQAQFARKALHAKTAFVLNDEEAFGEAFAQAFANEFKKEGGKVISYQGIDPTANDYSAILSNVKSANPDVLEFAGFYQPAGLLVKQARQMGIKSKYITDSAVYGPQYLGIAKKAAAGSYMTNLPLSGTVNPMEKYLANGLQHKYHLKADPIAANAFDAVLDVWHAAKLAKSTNPSDLIKVMHNVKFTGATGKVSFLPDGDRAQVDYTVMEVTPKLGYKTIKEIKEVLH